MITLCQNDKNILHIFFLLKIIRAKYICNYRLDQEKHIIWIISKMYLFTEM